MANLIQIKRSGATDAPTTLQPGELAYSFLNTSNSLFVGDASNNVIRIAGGKFIWLHQANTSAPGALTANAVVILNGNGYTTETRTNKLIVGADGTTINISSINATSNSTVLGGNSNTELPTSYAVQYYVEQKTASLGGSIADTQIVFSDSGTLAGNAALTFAKANTTVTATGNVVVGKDINGNGSISLQGANVDIEILQAGAHLGLTNYLFVATANVNNYAQIGLQNKGAGDNANASADFVAYPPGAHANDTTGFIDMGITSNSFSQAAYSVTQGFEGYVFSSALAGSGGSGSLVLATDSTGTNNSIRFYTNGFNQSVSSAAMIIDRNQRVGIGNVTPTHTLSVGGTTNISGAATLANTIAVTGNATFSNTVAIVGNLTLSSNVQATYANITVDAAVGGNLVVDGNATLGSNSSDTVAINGRVNTHIIPSHTQQLNLGNTTYEWAELRAQDGFFSRNLSVSGNLVVSGTLTTINSTDINISDPMIRVANGNLTTDLVDVGVFGSYGNSTVIQYTGLFRDASNGGRYKLFAGAIPEPSTTVDTSNAGFSFADLQVNILYANSVSTANVQVTGGSITGITDLVVADGGTGVSVFANNGIIYGQNTSALAVTSAGTQGQVLQAGAGGVPQFGTLDGGTF